MSKSKILVIDSDSVIRSGICTFLLAHGHELAEAGSFADARRQLDCFRPHAAILDFTLHNGDGLQLLRHMKGLECSIPVIALVSPGFEAAGRRATEEGAEGYFVKPVDLQDLHAEVRQVLSNFRRESSLCEVPAGRRTIDPFLGRSVIIRQLQKLTRRVLHSGSPVLLQGETGSGKGVLANWIHRNGPRAKQSFLDLNCAGLTRELLESELFGHAKGAFTSAIAAKPGLLEGADRGTVFLDEIGDMDPQVQPKLLKVLEERTFRRLGDVREKAVDIRLISATHRDLRELVCQGRFREDLYYRMNTVPIRVPALRDRSEDIPLLVENFLCELSQISGRGELVVESAAMRKLQQYSWPGNIRELRNALERAVLLADHKCLTADNLHLQSSPLQLQTTIPPTGTLKQMERSYIRHVLHDERGSIERSAKRLGIPRSSLYNKMKRFEIPPGTGRIQPS